MQTVSGNTQAKQRGIAAVEFAVILPVLIVLLAFSIFLARVFLHYSVAQKAAHSAAIYFGTIPLVEMNDPRWSLGAEAVANDIIADTVAELSPGGYNSVNVQVQCDGDPCGSARPQNVRVVVKMRVVDDFFNAFSYSIRGSEGIVIKGDVTMPYIGK